MNASLKLIVVSEKSLHESKMFLPHVAMLRAVYAVVCVCVCHNSVLYQNG